MAYQESEGIVLRTYNLNDGDKVAIVLTKDFGVIRSFAKGARKLKSKFGSSLEPLTIAKFSYIQRENHETVRLEKTEIQESNFNLAAFDSTLELTTYWTELILEFLPINMPEERIYRMLRACLHALGNSPDNYYNLTCYFEVWLLRLAGFFPDISRCRKCNAAIDKNNASAISTTGILCTNCHYLPGQPHSIYTLIDKIRRQSPHDFAKEQIAKPSEMKRLIEFVRTLVKEAIEERFNKISPR